MFHLVVGSVGIGPTTNRLRGDCSSAELRTHCAGAIAPALLRLCAIRFSKYESTAPIPALTRREASRHQCMRQESNLQDPKADAFTARWAHHTARYACMSVRYFRFRFRFLSPFRMVTSPCVFACVTFLDTAFVAGHRPMFYLAPASPHYFT